MADENKEPLTNHDYDGIQEYDNPLPSWWLWTFFFTIIFASLYYLHYEFGGGPTLQDELKESMKSIEQAAKKNAPVEAETEEQLAGIMGDPKVIQAGATLFGAKCAVCHGPELGGLIGPNLTDNYWIHGKGTRADILHVVREGVADKGMPPWGPILSKEEIYSAVAFVFSKKGSHPANPKAPQGEKVE